MVSPLDGESVSERKVARRFLESAKRGHDPLYAAYVLILVLGLRKGEVVGLPWSAVNLDGAELDIGWQLQRVPPRVATPGDQDRGLRRNAAAARHLRDRATDA
jgi:integrase